MSVLLTQDVGRAAYRPTLALQEQLWEKVRTAEEDLGYLVFVEHEPPVITLGRSAKPEHLLKPREELLRAGIEVHATGRGGDVTYHGPGQLVAYPIVRIEQHSAGVRDYVRRLEEAVIRAAAAYGIAARRIERMTGVWTEAGKVAAIGVAIRRGVSLHGLALNVNNDLSGFDLIVPCGLHGRPVTSLARLLGRPITVAEVQPRLTQCLAETLNFDVVQPAEDTKMEAP